VLALVLEQG
jgi:hypothetical protein